MKILALDTCTETIDVAIVENETLLVEKRGKAPRQQLTRLMPFIQASLEETAISIKDIDLIALTTGPGSFTGIRLGLATAKTLSQLNDIPLVSVNTIDAVAVGAEETGIVIPSLDARKYEIFYGVYKLAEHEAKNLSGYKKVRIDDYIDFINNLEYENFILTGSILWRYKDRLEKEVSRPFKTTEEYLWTPRGEIIARIGRKLALEGKAADYLHLEADYMRTWEAIPPKPLV
ncbi:MAG: tRNA (adenosine(37)-N6)-threonylcarbamoyltransferase complex dimerization subunit type 1 TsaB [Vulcanimicrobiota bacterium]